MSEQRHSHRRDFLTGRAAGQVAADAIQQAADHVAGFADALNPPTEGGVAEKPGYVVSLVRRAMACDFEVRLNTERSAGHPQSKIALAALDLIDDLESQLTVYRETSEVIELNRLAATESVSVESRLFGLLHLADRLHEDTGGALDITAGPLSRVWGFDRRQGRLPSEAEIAQALENVGWEKVVLDDSRNEIRFLQPGVEINVNSIGKGYAVDRAGELLREHGVGDFLLHGGRSTMLASGHHQGERGWLARLRHPLRPQQVIAEFVLENEALSTSGSATQSFVLGGRRYGHLIDPHTGWPADSMHSATVIAPAGALADGLSTAFYIMGVEAVQAYCDRHPEVRALLVLPAQRTGEVNVETFNLAQSD